MIWADTGICLIVKTTAQNVRIYFHLYYNPCVADLIGSIFHLFKARIGGAISRFK